ncbi:MAG: hypothetical protein FJ029_02020 [Actinobacteria bacterium]|nr:hypothetical protein [Actinomycetota bacterium]
MLTVTAEAAEALFAALQEANEPDSRAIRVISAPGNGRRESLRLEIDTMLPGDKRVDYDGRTILVAQPDVAAHLDNRTLGVERTAQGAVFRLRRTATPPSG